ncbi:MAG: C-GCAxxG-C-C family protein [Lachnospiraceae bacterium]|nr:C-GCAxxG-C-C family protein [Prevotella sp.]MCM1075584.1 C-GCAxxG-C-C family protein [Ruminococcus sp.]MCM1222995.1 C-GCAxxG-C-C family protein [Lachnospiraceae bacterium]
MIKNLLCGLTLEERLERARTYRAKGYNCAQCVAIAFPDITGMEDESVLKTAIGLGGGCGCGEICGVLSSMALLRGMMCEGAATDKAAVYADTRSLKDDFSKRFGSIICRELKAPGKPIPCNDLIYTGVEIFHNFIENA